MLIKNNAVIINNRAGVFVVNELFVIDTKKKAGTAIYARPLACLVSELKRTIKNNISGIVQMRPKLKIHAIIKFSITDIPIYRSIEFCKFVDAPNIHSLSESCSNK